MKHNFTLALVFMSILIAGISTACTKSKINPNDSTPPKVEIKVKGSNGQFEPASTADLSSTLDLSCVVSDPDGVKSIELKFLGGTSSTCTVGSSVFNGSFPVALPADQQQTLQGDASGNVLDTLPLFATLTAPTCHAGTQSGKPIGHEITVQCKGMNWSSNAQNNSAKAELKVTVK